MDIAIIGGGIAGLSCGWLLSQSKKNKVTLFEKQPVIGMDASSMDLNLNELDTDGNTNFVRIYCIRKS